MIWCVIGFCLFVGFFVGYGVRAWWTNRREWN